MAKTCAQLIARVQQLVGRATGGNTTQLDLPTIILDALNEAQIKIIRECPNLSDSGFQVKNTTSFDTVEDEYSVDISTIATSIAFIHHVWILDELNSKHLRFKPLDQFDEDYPSVSDIGSALPQYWTRRGTAIEFNCPVAAAYASKDIRIDYCKWATAFASTSSTAASEIQNADRGLILYAWSEALRATRPNRPNEANEKLILFEDWLDEFSQYHDFQTEEISNG